jgi:hypothetical protein
MAVRPTCYLRNRRWCGHGGTASLRWLAERGVEEGVAALEHNLAGQVGTALKGHRYREPAHVRRGGERCDGVPVGDVARGPARLGLPSAQDVPGGLDAVAPGRVAAQRAEVDAGRPDAGAVPVEHRGQPAVVPQRVAMPQVAVHQAEPAVAWPCRGHRRLGCVEQIRRALLAAHLGEVLGLDRPGPGRERRCRGDLDRVDPRRGRAQRLQPFRVGLRRDHTCPRHAGGEHEPVPGLFREVVADQLRDWEDGTGHPRRAGHRRDLGRGLRRLLGARDPENDLAVPGLQQPR